MTGARREGEYNTSTWTVRPVWVTSATLDLAVRRSTFKSPNVKESIPQIPPRPISQKGPRDSQTLSFVDNHTSPIGWVYKGVQQAYSTTAPHSVRSVFSLTSRNREPRSGRPGSPAHPKFSPNRPSHDAPGRPTTGATAIYIYIYLLFLQIYTHLYDKAPVLDNLSYRY